MSIYAEDVIKRVLSKLDPQEILQRINYRTTTIQKRDSQIRCFCPIHKEAVFRTLIVQGDTKQFRCSYTLCPGAKGGDLIKLYALAKEISYDDSLRELAEAFHLEIELPSLDDFVQSKLAEAGNYLDMEAADEALTAFKLVLKSDPENLEANQGLLKALLLGRQVAEANEQRMKVAALAKQQGHWQVAREILEEQVDRNPDDDEARNLLIQLYQEQDLKEELVGQYMALAERHESAGEYDDAIRMYRNVEQAGAAIVDVFPYVVQLLRESGRRSDAVAEHLKRAQSLEEEGYPDVALENLGEALEIDPERNDIRLHAIEIAAAGVMSPALSAKALRWVDGYFQRQLHAEALEALEILKPRLPRDERIEDRMLRALEAQGKRGDAEQLRARIVDEWIAAGNLQAARDRLEALAQSSPDSIELSHRKARLLARMGAIAEASAAYQTLVSQLRRIHDKRQIAEVFVEWIDLRPEDLELREAYREVLMELGQPQQAQAVCLELAERYIEAERADEALARLDEAVQYSPDDDELRLRLARAAERLGRISVAADARIKAAERKMTAEAFADASALLETALKLDPQNTTILDHLATCNQHTGDIARACLSLEQLANIYEEREDWASAEAALRRIAQMDAGQMLARERLATVVGRRGRIDEEVSILQEVGRRYLGESSYSRAEDVCRRILDRKPNHVDALEMLIKISEASHKRQVAQGLYRRLADVYHELDDVTNERRTYERTLENWPDDHDIRRRYVILLWEQQDVTRMRNEAQQLSGVLLRLRRFEETDSFLSHMQRIAPAEPLFLELAIDLYDKWGRAEEWSLTAQMLVDHYKRRNLPADAAPWMQRLVERSPADESLRAEYIQLLLQAENRPEAATQYAQLGALYQEKGALEDAIAAYQSALELDASLEDVTMALIRLYLQQKMNDEALKSIHALAGLREAREAHDEAIAVLRMAFEMDRDSVEVRQKIVDLLLAKGAQAEALAELDILCGIHEGNENWPAAVAIRRRKIELMPEDAVAREDLIDLLRRRGSQEDRFNEELALAQFQMKKNQPALAIEILERLGEEDPGSLPVRRLRAEAYAANGDDKKALAEFMFISTRFDELRGSGAAQSAPLPAIKLSVVKDYIFENFVVGPRNNFAYATSMAVAKAPGQTYNPLFLYSDVGLGKTHLLHAIANYLSANRPELRMLYTSADEFISELVDAIENNTVKEFRARHKATDVLLLDDVQFLAGKERAQEEFFHIFNTLFQAQRQIVVTSDRPPKDMAHLEKRLLSRFGAGVIVDIQSPDIETRVAILQREMKHLAENGVPQSLAVRLAERFESNVRELKGAFNQIVAISRTRGGGLSDEELDEAIADVLQKI